MERILAIFRNGQVEFDSPVTWPDGTRVSVIPVEESYGIDESQWPETPEQRQEWLRWFDSIEPFELTPEDEAKTEAAMQQHGQFNVEATRKHWDDMEKLF